MPRLRSTWGAPTLLVFGRDGAAAGSFYGAPPSLHAQVEGRIQELLD